MLNTSRMWLVGGWFATVALIVGWSVRGRERFHERDAARDLCGTSGRHAAPGGARRRPPLLRFFTRRMQGRPPMIAGGTWIQRPPAVGAFQFVVLATLRATH